MQRLVAWGRREWPTLLVVAIGAAIEFFLATRSFSFLLNNLLPDDTFFYFTIARNIAAGIGSTFDGLHATNGYHPLWLLVLAVLYKIYPSTGVADTTVIQVAIFLQACIALATALVISRILARFTQRRWIRAFGMMVWFLNPFLLYEQLNGLETVLALFFLSILVWLALRIQEGKPMGGWWLPGAVGGLMIVERLDMVFYFGFFLLWLWARGGWKEGFWRAFWCGAVGAVPLAIWIGWSAVHFHMLFTSASGAESLVNHTLVYQDNGYSWYQFFKAIVFETQFQLDTYFQKTGMYALGCGFLGAFVALILSGSISVPRKLRDISATSALFLGWVLLFIADASVRWAGRTWYFVSFQLFLAILTVVVLDRLLPHITYKRTVAALIACLTLFSFFVNWSKNFRGANNDYSTQYQLVVTSEWMNENLPAGSLVGSFSPGIQGYFSTLHIVDLDALVDNSAYEAMKKHALWQYVVDEHITYLAMYDTGINYRYKSFWGEDPLPHLTLIKTFYGTPPAGLQVYKVN